MIGRANGLRLAAVLFPLLLFVETGLAEELHDIVLRNGRIIDPATGMDVVASVGIRGNKISALTQLPLRGRREIDVSGLVVAPGFIDLHSHGQTPISDRYQVMDGVTTALDLEIGAYPIADWYGRRAGKALINFGIAVSHALIRAAVIMSEDLDPTQINPQMTELWSSDSQWRSKAATPVQIQSIGRRIREQLDQGGLAVGVPLGYLPGVEFPEVLQAFDAASEKGALVFTHVRERLPGQSSLSGIVEVLALSSISGASLHIGHINSTAAEHAAEALVIISRAAVAGIDVSTEAYPYAASSTFISAIDPVLEAPIGEVLDYSQLEWVATGERLTAESFQRYKAEQPLGFVILHTMDPQLVDQVVVAPGVMVVSDGMGWETGNEHPRGAGTFARVLGRYVRDQNTLSLMDALAKMTIEPARRLQSFVPAMARKGRLQVGADADITVFDLDLVKDQASYREPMQSSRGIQHVFVGGVQVVQEAQLLGSVRPGQAVLSNES